MHLTGLSVFGRAAQARPQGKFNADLMSDSKARAPTALRFEKCFDLNVPSTNRCMDHAIQNTGSNVSVSHLSARPPFRSKWHRTGPCYKTLQKSRKGRGGEKKGQIVCVLTAFRVIYTEWKKKLCRLHVSTWWELLNYWWMFLITSHKCWNITLLQCLEDEEGGLQCLACLGKHWLALNHGGPCVMALEMWLWERKVSIPSAGARERKWVIKPGGEKKRKKKRSFGGVLEPVILGST